MRAFFSERPLRALMLALALTCLAGWGFKAHCTAGGWTGSEQYTTGCYSDIFVFWTAREQDKGKIPYFQTRVEYPVLTGAAIGIEAAANHIVFGPGASDRSFLFIATLVNAALAMLVLRLFFLAGMEPRRLWMWALAPPLVLYVGHNWDMVAVTFAVGAMLLARAGRLEASAAAAGLGVAAKLYPGLMLPLIGLQALFARGEGWPRRLARAALLSAAAIGAWALINLPVALAAYDNWSEFFRFSAERGGTAAGTWDVLRTTGWLFLWDEDRNRVAALTFVVGAALIVAAGWRRDRDRLWLLFTPLLAWFLLTNKVYSPQFDLWLYPMLLMTAPRLAPVALFVLADIAAYFAEFWWFAAAEGAWPATTYTHIALAAAVRGAILLWIIADCLRSDPPAWLSRTASGQAGD